MSIKLDATNLWQEWEGAAPFQSDLMEGVDEQLTRYRGRQASKLSTRRAQDALEPHEFEVLSKTFARLANDNPIFRCSTRSNDPEAEAVAPALADAVNQICVETNFRNEAILALLDFEFIPAVFRVTMEDDYSRGMVDGAGPGGKGKGIPMRSVARRESPLRTRWDTQALNITAAAWTGWQSIHDRKGLIAHALAHPEERWNVRALRELEADVGTEEVRGERHTPSRDEVTVVNMWIRECDPETKAQLFRDIPEDQRHYFNGVICRIAMGGGSRGAKDGTAHMLAPPVPFFGPPEGPLCIGYCYPLFDKPGGFGASKPVKGIVDALNRAVDAENERSDKHRSFGLVDGTERQISKIQNAKDGSLHAMPGLKKEQFVAVEIGGPTEMGQALIQIYQARLAKASAMSTAASGTVTGDGTATEVIEAGNTLDERTGFQATQFRDLLRRVGKAMAWYCYHSLRVVQPVSDEVAAQLPAGQPRAKVAPDGTAYVERPKRVMFEGGPRDGQKILPGEFERFQFVLDPTSMAWQSDESQMRLFALVNEEILTIGPQVANPMMQHVEWDDIAKLKAKATGHPIFRRMFNLQTAALLAQSQALMMQAQTQEQGKNPAAMSSKHGEPQKRPEPTPAGRPKPTVTQTAGTPNRAPAAKKSPAGQKAKV